MDMNFMNEATEYLPATIPDVKHFELKVLEEKLEKLYVGLDTMKAHLFTYQNVRQCTIEETRNILNPDLANLIDEYESIQYKLLDILKLWQRKQALAILSEPLPCHLDEIQYIVEILMDRIEDIKLFIATLLSFEYEPKLENHSQRVQRLQHVLIVSSFIVEEQPPQVKKKLTKFSAKIRWLIANKLNIYSSKPKVVCAVLSEAQVKEIDLESLQIPVIHQGSMSGNECEMNYDNDSRRFSAEFANLTITNIDRSERRGSESVKDEKCALLFYTTVNVGYPIKCGALTLPMVVTVHDMQAPQAWATITWDNAFSSIKRVPFKVPDRVHISGILEMLSMNFAHTTGRPLSYENMEFLRKKLLGTDNGLVDEYVSYAQIARDKIPPEHKFTFWEWFYGVKKLTREYFKETWMSGHVVGFISKNEAKRILSLEENGTFLIRFSDSVIGGITVAYRDFYGQLKIISPWKWQDLQTRSLSDRIRDVDILSVVYPTRTPSVLAFCRSTHANRVTTRDGYDGTMELRVQITSQPANNFGQQIQQQISQTANSEHSLSSPNNNDFEILKEIMNEFLSSSSSEGYQSDPFL
ncbi:signal transducer and transcription activator isoform X1 [Ceratitis capitata]|uniref:signal transducer and transcription activator isoform X1 n=1 Tax=Ceratitis capitata TaxID=7213 RepID=UPI000A11B57E|nr:signal transducer and transcription activator isoform X1 [Ceratitis capitata]XP_020717387.1 signal transducer and transcription activator isoform X1 [Ceratitis capitata]